VKQWLSTHEKWLLILDNAEDLKTVQDFMPLSETGHILLTTRIQSTGDIASSIEVNKMDEEEGILLLLRRSKALAIDAPLNQTSQENQKIAQAIVKQVDGLPLALDQAGAYIEETGCRLTDYLKLYTVYRRDLLKRNSKFAPHPDVATTFTLAFQKVEQTDFAAADLLRFFAFLDPDAIPEEIISKGASTLGPAVQSVAQNPLKLQETLGLLRNFSLIRRSVDTGTLAIHRLVQAVIRDDMNKRTQQLWAKRTVKVVSQTFPDVEVANWAQCERCLPHALICFTLIEQYQMSFQEATDLSFLVGAYLYQHSRLIEAESILKRDLNMMEKVRGPKNIFTAQSLNNLAALYRTQGKYEQTEPLYQRALAIIEEQLGPDHSDTARCLNNLALLYYTQGQYEQAEPLSQRALAIFEQQLGPDHPDTAKSLNNLAELYRTQGKYEQAEPLLQRALAITEQQLGPDHPDTARSLNNLALLYYTQGQYEQAEPLYQRALAITERQLGPDHPDTITTQGNYDAFLKEEKRMRKGQ